MSASDIIAEPGQSRVDMVMAAVRRQIASHHSQRGAKLSSIRAMAQRMGVSKSTVVEAYDRLVAEGVIAARPSAGFFASGHLPPLSLASLAPGDPPVHRDVDPVWMTRQALDHDRDLLKPGCGWLPEAWMPSDDIRRALRRMARDEQAHLVNYASPLGLAPLRQVLSRRMADRGIEAPPPQIMITESGTHAVDLLCRFLLKPGDTVLLDDPCYFNFHAMMRAHRVNVVSVAYTANGPDLAQLEQVLGAHRVRLYITNSALHNPTGATLSPVVAHRVLKLAEAHDLVIIEDDIFADFEHEPAPRLAAFDGLERVIHVGSFSKTLSAAVRCGFIAVRPDWVDELVDLKLATSFGGGAFSADLVLRLLTDGAYRRHMSGVRACLADAMGKVIAQLAAFGITPWLEPKAGMFLWCKLPGALDAANVARHALADGVVLAPGQAFSLKDEASGFVRFNVAQTLDPAIFPAVERAMLQAHAE
ncbi:MAG: PLP-dependent aminotransferase family protein [Hyphomicrobiales bacterium]